MRLHRHLPEIGLAVVAITTAALTSGCYTSSGRTHRAGGPAPVRSETSPAMFASARSETPRTSPSSTGRTGSTSQMNEGASTIVIPLYEERLRTGTRQVEAGSVRIRKEITTETVNQPVQVRRETLVIDRLPADSQGGTAASAQFSGSDNAGTPFQQNEIEIRLMREEPVVEKQVVQTGRIVAEKRVQTEQANVQQQVRRENIDLNRLGNAQNVIISENLRQASPRGFTGGTGAASQQESGPSGSITSVQALKSGDHSDLLGKEVRLTGVTVRQVVGDRALIIESQGSEALVRNSQAISSIKPGDRVQITGTIHKTPETVAELGVSGEQSHIVQNHPVFIEARSVQRAQQQQGQQQQEQQQEQQPQRDQQQ